jgi:DNA replication protein DnaC
VSGKTGEAHFACFPIHRDLAGFDFDQSKVDRRQIMTIATTSFTEKAENTVLIGGTGTGKPHLATALGIEAVTGNESYRFRQSSSTAKAHIKSREQAKAQEAIDEPI